MRPRVLLGAAVAAGLATTAIVLAVPFVRVAYRSPDAHVALETAEGVIGLFVVALVYGRFARAAQLHLLLVGYGLALLASTNIFLSVIPVIAIGDRESALATWGPAVARLAGAAVLAAGSVVGTTEVGRPRRTVGLASAALVAGLVAITATVDALADRLPNAVDVSPPVGTSATPRLDGHPAVVLLQVAAFALFAVAAWGFVRRAERDHDELFAWFAGGAALAAIARVNYVLYPSIYTEYVYSGDLLRLASYALYLVGASRELLGYWRAARDVAVAEDRRRMARDLHDGLAQELAFIAAHARRLDDDLRLRPIATAAERALDEARAAISALNRHADQPVDVAIDHAASDVAGRLGIDLDLNLDRSVHVPPSMVEALARVVRESVSNAARHGAASRVAVRLEPGPPTRLTVTDDGTGFDVGAPRRPGSHGIVSMTERIVAVGGQFALRSHPGRGTTVEVLLP